MLIESKGSRTLSKFRQVLEKVEGRSSHPKHESNFVRIHFPHTPGLPSGTRLVGERGIIEEVTYRIAQQYKREGKDMRGSIIPIENKRLLAIAPLCVDAGIDLRNVYPSLISSFPGNAQHYISSIRCPDSNFEKLFEDTHAFNIKMKLKSDKGFVIKELMGGERKWEQVIFYQSAGMEEVLYKEGDSYYYQELGKNKERKEISTLEFVIEFLRIKKNTTPSNEAIRSVSGGQESLKDFDERVSGEDFWGDLGPDEIIEKACQSPESLSEDEITSLLFFLSRKGEESDILLIKEFFQLLPNLEEIKDFSATPFLVQLIANNHLSLLESLVSENNINVNLVDEENGIYPLHLPVFKKNIEALKIILSSSQVDVECKDEQNWTPIMFVRDVEMLNILIGAGTDINAVSSDGVTLLNRAVRLGNDKLIEACLNFGADPNMGGPCALVNAIIQNDSLVIEMLLERGADLLIKDSSKCIPLFESLYRSPPEIFESLFLSCKEELLKSSLKEELLIKAMELGDRKKIEFLRKNGIHLTDKVLRRSQALMNVVLWWAKSGKSIELSIL